MKFILCAAGVILSITAAGSNLLELWADHSLENALAVVESTNAAKESRQELSFVTAAGSTRVAKERELALARYANNVPLAGAWSDIRLFTLFRKLGDDSRVTDERIRYYCQALEAIGGSLVKEPLNSRYLVNWANLRQLLGTFKCNAPHTEGDFMQVVEFALKSDPTNTTAMYASALIYIWAGEKEKALALFHRVLEYGINLSEGQLRAILAQIGSDQDVLSIVPARFPQVASWSALIKEKLADHYSAMSESLSTLQSKAINESIESFESGKIPAQLHYERLLSLLDVVSSTAVRQQLDSELARFLGRLGNKKVSDYFTERKGYQLLDFNSAAISSDTRPQKTPLVRWGESSQIYFDDFYRSIGFYLPEGQIAKVIELNGLGGALQFPLEIVKVFGSNDNSRWVELGEDLKVQSFSLGGRMMLVFHPSGENFKYWKINFSSTARTKSFYNNLIEMVQVYGVSGSTARKGR